MVATKQNGEKEQQEELQQKHEQKNQSLLPSTERGLEPAQFRLGYRLCPGRGPLHGAKGLEEQLVAESLGFWGSQERVWYRVYLSLYVIQERRIIWLAGIAHKTHISPPPHPRNRRLEVKMFASQRAAER